jgi:hypothetical protein
MVKQKIKEILKNEEGKITCFVLMNKAGKTYDFYAKGGYPTADYQPGNWVNVDFQNNKIISYSLHRESNGNGPQVTGIDDVVPKTKNWKWNKKPSSFNANDQKKVTSKTHPDEQLTAIINHLGNINSSLKQICEALKLLYNK